MTTVCPYTKEETENKLKQCNVLPGVTYEAIKFVVWVCFTVNGSELDM
jgi:hypothetical protein